VDPIDDFRSAGRTIFSLGLVREAEGNLSVFDGTMMTITRTGAALAGLEPADLITGELDEDLPGASSDVDVHRRTYRERGVGAVAHAHPAGTVPEDGGGPGEHGVYAFASSLEEAVADVVRRAREAGIREGRAR
jgi:ribulose-5-phosphate 4-epimerase/fuculose-1-phosphate aldolase